MQRTFDEKLKDYAALTIRLGINVQPGQELIISAPVFATEFVRMLVAEAYKAGSKNVQVLYNDEEVSKSRFVNGSDEAAGYAPQWFFDGIAAAHGSGAARLSVASSDPGLLADIDPAKVGAWYGATSTASKKVSELVGSMAINWSVIAVPNPVWAQMVFPGESENLAVDKLWDAIFSVARVNSAEPLKAWEDHCDSLEKRQTYLNNLNLRSVCFKGPGTDLEVGLVEKHEWVGGWGYAKNGVKNAPNIPTEEVFTMPHRDRTNGTVSSTMPLSLRGQVVEGIKVEFKNGVAVAVSAKSGESTLVGLMDTDEGGRRLGEIALVPPSGAVAQTGLLFYNTLFDENAACHIAMGSSYSENLPGVDDLSEGEKLAAGANQSKVHMDWMIGSPEVEVDGILQSGERVALMRGNDWVEQV
jgi:aminopeptidase